MSDTMTVRDYERGARPRCNGCACELDPEMDAQHDGYDGSPHAHGGRGSYGNGSHHYVFAGLCEACRESRTAPLRRILERAGGTERLACGHTIPTPYNRFGSPRPGGRRRCDKCRTCRVADFAPWVPPPTWQEQIRARLSARCDAVYSDDTPRAAKLTDSKPRASAQPKQTNGKRN